MLFKYLVFVALLATSFSVFAQGRLPRIYDDPVLYVNCLNTVDIQYMVQPHACELIIVRALNGECYQSLSAQHIIHLVPRIDTPLVVTFSKKVGDKLIYLFTKNLDVQRFGDPDLLLIGIDSFSLGEVWGNSEGAGGCFTNIVSSLEPQLVILRPDYFLARYFPQDASYRFDSVFVHLFNPGEDSIMCNPPILLNIFYGVNEFSPHAQLPDTLTLDPSRLKVELWIVFIVSLTRKAFDGSEYPEKICYNYELYNCLE